MPFLDQRRFLQVLEREGELARIDTPVDARLEITEIAGRVVRAGGPAMPQATHRCPTNAIVWVEGQQFAKSSNELEKRAV